MLLSPAFESCIEVITVSMEREFLRNVGKAITEVTVHQGDDSGCSCC